MRGRFRFSKKANSLFGSLALILVCISTLTIKVSAIESHNNKYVFNCANNSQLFSSIQEELQRTDELNHSSCFYLTVDNDAAQKNNLSFIDNSWSWFTISLIGMTISGLLVALAINNRDDKKSEGRKKR